ncbi:MAG: UDP-N-acetylglucosamine--N-acetylmuramyl-(pentapeptide) pyrophosphoryl-undecaprenol N-acetylglucosamine transferase [Verrucomicrobia subdivision 3 bacterium]|nr:UDP-N-acetylglucosamine--N-acetylmuramyl-(pentapeptide) pyrophosphoryl-undecaprenol N-acetylglucosamine transferase [Limisphaerales bacterium]MCS1412387.1 UDP-N-acetylglucosamine--N-acetylmuramyl-(pentapeptide) pyrophosphoryl-undecaprenol N-acetylglucosamine transferase [Limisphaerales bacterium]
MSRRRDFSQCKVAIACGGTGGHFFPGLAIGQEVIRRGGQVLLLASRKGIDRVAASTLPGSRIEFLPSVALIRGQVIAFAWGLIQSLGCCLRCFSIWKPDIVLVMGGFTSVAPAVAGRLLGARVYLHEANSVPGRANRSLAGLCHGIFVGFPFVRKAFRSRAVRVSGTPVRSQFEQAIPPDCYDRLGLAADAPILLVMGGSQGARAINDLMLEIAPYLAHRHPGLQVIHLTGRHDRGSLQALYQRLGMRHYVSEFCADTSELVRVATAVLSRAGASSLAEYAAARVPALLVPYPQAVDDHQKQNAMIFGDGGAAEWLDQRTLKPSFAAQVLSRLLFDRKVRRSMKEALQRWDARGAAGRIADGLMGEWVTDRGATPAGETKGPLGRGVVYKSSSSECPENRLSRALILN